MKRLISWILAVMCLMGAAAAAETPREFDFRSGVKWGMTEEEVLYADGVRMEENYQMYFRRILLNGLRYVLKQSCFTGFWR